MLLLVGLGNPGPQYAHNRHNIGFMAVDAIARAHRFRPFRAKFQGEIAEGEVAGERMLALKPFTYMNESGRSVAEAARFYKVAPADVLVFHDELDLPAGRVRCKVGGGHGGHNGLRSITSHIGAEFRRVRLGVGHPGDRDQVVGHVLKDFARADRAWLEPLLDAVARYFPMLAARRESEFMNRVALDTRPPKPKSQPASGAGGAVPSGA